LKKLSKKEAIALTSGPFGAEVEAAVVNYTIPFLWFTPTAENDLNARNGTAFFVTADQTFVVTANHVFDGYLKSRELFGARVHCQLGELRFNPQERLIAQDENLDIATFSISLDEVRQSYEGKSAMSFDPMMPKIGKGVLFAGFPGRERRRLQPRAIESGVFTALTVADNVSNLQISGHFERKRQVENSRRPTAPVGYDYRGVSGGPLLTIVESEHLWYWRLGGVMTEFNANLEIFYATRADFLLPDGTLKKL
jgi:Trypsin-like peptidase domain